jgi:hypothetical protein
VDNYLSSYEREILESLAEDGGFITKDVARHVTFFGHNARTHSGAVRSWLAGLKKRGLVDLIDDQKPAAWKRTAAGTAAIFHEVRGAADGPESSGVRALK